MDDAKRDLVRAWLVRAQRDLDAARTLAGADPPQLDSAVYHCQQAAEKAVKGFLTLHDRHVDKTHDVQALMAAAQPADPAFDEWLAAGERLTPYATAYRYPGEELEPDREEYETALADAAGVVAFVLSRVPPETRP